MNDARISIVAISDAIQDTMRALGINGSFDVRHDGCRSTGWIGSPTGTDYAVEVTVSPLPDLAPVAHRSRKVDEV